jgi:hypothetical protein
VRRQYESISFNNGESLDDFALRLAKMVHELEILGDPEEPRKVAAKYLRVVLKRFAPVAISIESLLDISTMSIEEITGRLRAVEGCGDDDDDDEPVAGGKLLLTEEQWQARPVKGVSTRAPAKASRRTILAGRGRRKATGRTRSRSVPNLRGIFVIEDRSTPRSQTKQLLGWDGSILLSSTLQPNTT